MTMIRFGIAELYCGASGKTGYYNSQEIGLARAMKKLGYRCFIFYPAPDAAAVTEEDVEEHITIVRCPARAIGVHARYDWKILKKYRIDVVQLGGDNQIFAPDFIRYCDKNGIPVYNFIGTVGTDSHNAVKKRLMDLMFRRNIVSYRGHMNFAKTENVRRALKNVGIDNAAVAPVGLDVSVIPVISGTPEEIKRECGLPPDKKTVLFVGRIDAYKHPEKMLELLSALPDEFYGVMIGDGELADGLERMIKEMKLSDRLKWIRKLPNQEVQKYYYVADCFVNFNDKEIFGMSILEAMYQGCKVIAVHAPGPDSIIENGISGYLVKSAEDMPDLITSDEKDEKLEKHKIVERIRTNFTWEHSAALFDGWIRSALNLPPRPRD